MRVVTNVIGVVGVVAIADASVVVEPDAVVEDELVHHYVGCDGWHMQAQLTSSDRAVGIAEDMRSLAESQACSAAAGQN